MAPIENSVRAWVLGMTPRILVLLGAVALRVPTLGQALTEVHSFRQTQTAYTAVIYARDGIDLLHPELPVLGPPWQVPLEFPLYQAASSIAMGLGLAPEVALRLTCLIAFAITSVLLWVLLDRHASRRAADLGALVFLLSPLSLLWSRTSSIEYVAVLGAISFVLGVMEARGRGTCRWAWLLVALVGASVGMLVKPTTAAFYILPAALLLPWRLRPFTSLLVAGVPVALSLLWTWHAGAIRGGQAILRGCPVMPCLHTVSAQWIFASALRRGRGSDTGGPSSVEVRPSCPPCWQVGDVHTAS